jgi:hypothetical protein
MSFIACIRDSGWPPARCRSFFFSLTFVSGVGSNSSSSELVYLVRVVGHVLQVQTLEPENRRKRSLRDNAWRIESQSITGQILRERAV